MTQRDTAATLAYYRSHVTTSDWGFNPNGMCQKICRVARNIGPGFASALAQQIATPREFRIYEISKITRGMVMYFDDPNDGNPYGHVVTVMGRAKGVDRSSLRSLIVRTNSVKSGRVVPVRADYFPRYWGDQFQFAGEWINGVVLDLPETQEKKQPKHPLIGTWGRKRLMKVLDIYDELIAANKGDKRKVVALRRDRKEVLETLNRKVA